MMNKTDIQSELPLSETSFFILLSMVKEPKHGYAIMKDVLVLSQQRIELSTGTLYGALKRMLEREWIEPIDLDEGNEDARERKWYRLTPYGQKIVKAELARLQSIIQAVRLRVSGEI